MQILDRHLSHFDVLWPILQYGSTVLVKLRRHTCVPHREAENTERPLTGSAATNLAATRSSRGRLALCATDGQDPEHSPAGDAGHHVPTVAGCRPGAGCTATPPLGLAGLVNRWVHAVPGPTARWCLTSPRGCGYLTAPSRRPRPTAGVTAGPCQPLYRPAAFARACRHPSVAFATGPTPGAALVLQALFPYAPLPSSSPRGSPRLHHRNGPLPLFRHDGRPRGGGDRLPAPPRPH